MTLNKSSGFYIFFLLLVISTSTVLGQTGWKFRKLSIGATIGINNGWAKRTGLYSATGTKIEIRGEYGFAGGIEINYALTNRVNINSDLSYIRNNYSGASNSSFISQEFNEHISWTELKAGVDYTFLQKPISPFAGFGFSYRYLLKSKAEQNRTYSNGQSVSTEGNITDFRKRSNYLLHFEAGASFSRTVKVKFLYSHGLRDIVQPPEYDPSFTIDSALLPKDYKLRSITLSVSYLFLH